MNNHNWRVNHQIISREYYSNDMPLFVILVIKMLYIAMVFRLWFAYLCMYIHKL